MNIRIAFNHQPINNNDYCNGRYQADVDSRTVNRSMRWRVGWGESRAPGLRRVPPASARAPWPWRRARPGPPFGAKKAGLQRREGAADGILIRPVRATMGQAAVAFRRPGKVSITSEIIPPKTRAGSRK